MTETTNSPVDVECPAVPGSTYWCFTPDHLDAALAGWVSQSDPVAAQADRDRVRAFLYSAGVFRGGLRKETRQSHNPVIDAHGE